MPLNVDAVGADNHQRLHAASMNPRKQHGQQISDDTRPAAATTTSHAIPHAAAVLRNPTYLLVESAGVDVHQGRAAHDYGVTVAEEQVEVLASDVLFVSIRRT